MKIVSHPEILLDRIDDAAAEALEDSRAEAQASAPRDTGEYAGTIEAHLQQQGDRVEGRLGSPHPAARALELGADVGSRRGPHMRAQPHIRPAGERFPDHMTSRLRERSGTAR